MFCTSFPTEHFLWLLQKKTLPEPYRSTPKIDAFLSVSVRAHTDAPERKPNNGQCSVTLVLRKKASTRKSSQPFGRQKKEFFQQPYPERITQACSRHSLTAGTAILLLNQTNKNRQLLGAATAADFKLLANTQRPQCCATISRQLTDVPKSAPRERIFRRLRLAKGET